MSILNNSRIRVWGGFALAAIVLFAVAPAVLSDFRLSLLGKFLCFAIVAVGIGLAWGRGGMLTLGQGVHGVRETFSYTLSGTADTWDEVALTNANQTTMYTLVLHCTTSCYDSDQAQINQVMSSFTVRSSS